MYFLREIQMEYKPSQAISGASCSNIKTCKHGEAAFSCEAVRKME